MLYIINLKFWTVSYQREIRTNNVRILEKEGFPHTRVWIRSIIRRIFDQLVDSNETVDDVYPVVEASETVLGDLCLLLSKDLPKLQICMLA